MIRSKKKPCQARRRSERDRQGLKCSTKGGVERDEYYRLIIILVSTNIMKYILFL